MRNNIKQKKKPHVANIKVSRKTCVRQLVYSIISQKKGECQKMTEKELDRIDNFCYQTKELINYLDRIISKIPTRERLEEGTLYNLEKDIARVKLARVDINGIIEI